MTVLGANDPPPFERVNPDGGAPCLILCDHASPAIPEALGNLGLDESLRHDHIAWDIGAAAIARRLAALFDGPAILAGYSRLVVDCNRYLDDPSAFAPVSDMIAVPGNRTMTAEERARRIGQVYRRYHGAIDDILDGFDARGIAPAVISVHTMTAQLRGQAPRQEDFAVCWARDDRFAMMVLERLRARGDIVVGDNTPYGLDPGTDYTIPEHAMRRGLAHLQFEVRQDHVTDGAGAGRWAELVHGVTKDLVADSALRAVRLYWP